MCWRRLNTRISESDTAPSNEKDNVVRWSNQNLHFSLLWSCVPHKKLNVCSVKTWFQKRSEWNVQEMYLYWIAFHNKYHSLGSAFYRCWASFIYSTSWTWEGIKSASLESSLCEIVSAEDRLWHYSSLRLDRLFTCHLNTVAVEIFAVSCINLFWRQIT